MDLFNLFSNMKAATSPLPSFIAPRVLRGRYLFLNLNPPATKEIILTCSGWEECAQGYEINRHGFSYWALEYIVSGTWEHTHEGKTEILGPGSIFTYGPSTDYSLKAVSGNHLSKYFIDFTGSHTSLMLAATRLKPGKPRKIVHRRWIQDLLDQIIDTARLPVTPRKELSKMLVEILLKRLGLDLKSAPVVSVSRQSYERCREYLVENYLSIRSLALAARDSGVSPVHLSRLFKRYDTESPKALLMRLKMNHAAELILRENLQVKSAANEVGFDDPYHFSRCFKRVHGISPIRFGK